MRWLVAMLLVAFMTLGAADGRAEFGVPADPSASAGSPKSASAGALPVDRAETSWTESLSVATQEAAVGAAIVGGAFAVGILATGSLATGIGVAGAAVIGYAFLP